jgi:hypothetical protein
MHVCKFRRHKQDRVANRVESVPKRKKNNQKNLGITAEIRVVCESLRAAGGAAYLPPSRSVSPLLSRGLWGLGAGDGDEMLCSLLSHRRVDPTGVWAHVQ